MNAHALDVQEAMTELAGKYLTFYLGDEGYGLEILKVQEIIGLPALLTLQALQGGWSIFTARLGPGGTGQPS